MFGRRRRQQSGRAGVAWSDDGARDVRPIDAAAASLTVENASDQLARAAADHLTRVLQVTAQFDSTLAAHRDRADEAAETLTQISDARTANLVRTGQAVTENIERAAAEARTKIEEATVVATQQLHLTEAQLRGRLEYMVGHATFLRRLTLAVLVVVSVIAVAGLVLALGDSGTF